MGARINSTGKKVALGGFSTALAVICLYLAGILPTNRLLFYSLSSMMLLVMVVEFNIKAGVLVYVSTTILGFIIVPNKLILIPYALFFGYYGITKYYIERLDNLLLEWAIKIAVFNLAMYIVYLIAKGILFENITIKFPILITILLGEIAFIVYDYGYSLAISYYKTRFRKMLGLK